MELLKPEYSHISTGRLPKTENVERLVNDAYERFRSVTLGETSQRLF